MSRRKRKATDLLDLFGIASFIAALAFYALSQYPNAVGNEALGALWANLATEGLGIWLTVRIIDRLLRHEDKWRKTRVSLVRNCRYLVRALKIANVQRRTIDVDLVRRELRYAAQRLERTKEHLDATEIEAVSTLHSSIDNRLDELEDEIKEPPPRPGSIEAIIGVIDLSGVSLALIELELETVESEILDESPEDDA